MSGPTVTIQDQRAHLTFDRFDLAASHAFLAVKRLPEHELVYDPMADSYQVSTPARFAPLLTGAPGVRPASDVELAPHLFDYQAWIVRTAFEAKRYASSPTSKRQRSGKRLSRWTIFSRALVLKCDG